MEMHKTKNAKQKVEWTYLWAFNNIPTTKFKHSTKLLKKNKIDIHHCPTPHNNILTSKKKYKHKFKQITNLTHLNRRKNITCTNTLTWTQMMLTP
jgi:hypothetical protein